MYYIGAVGASVVIGLSTIVNSSIIRQPCTYVTPSNNIEVKTNEENIDIISVIDYNDNTNENVEENNIDTNDNDFEKPFEVTEGNIIEEGFDENGEYYCVVECVAVDIDEESYVPNELIALVDNEEMVNDIAEQYGFTVDSYQYGVAVFDTNEQNPKDFLNEEVHFELNYSNYSYETATIENDVEEIVVDNND